MRMRRLLRFTMLLALVATGVLALGASQIASTQSDTPRQVKVLTVAMFEIGEMTGDFAGEAQLWVENEGLDEVIEVPASYSPVYCNADDHCLVVTGVGIANAASTIMAVGLSEALDLSQAYILVAGIAGVDPADGTLGSAAWAHWVIDGGLTHLIDAREMPSAWDFPYFRLGCSEPWCEDGWSYGVEAFQLNPDLAEWAYRLSQGVALEDNETAQAYRANYPEDLPASAPPSVIRCDSFASSTYWHGKLLSGWANWWAGQWSEGLSNYCMTEMEDSGTLTALARLAQAGRVDLNRVLVLRTASNFDQQYPGQTAAESIRAENGGFVPSVSNAYLVGSAVVDHIIANWDEWQDGPPPLE